MSLFSFLAAAVGPLAVRVLTALGVSVITFTGVTAAVEGLVSAVQSGWGGMPAAMAGLVGVSGAPEALGLVLGAVNARVALWVAASASKWAIKGAS